MKRDENGYIVVETVGSFVVLVLLMVSIISLINIVTVQARVHYALTQTAQTLSVYSYALEKVGLAEPLMGIAGRADNAQTELDTFKGNVNGILSALDGFSTAKGFGDLYNSGNMLVDSGQKIWQQAEGLSERDPKDILQDFMSFGIDQTESALFQMVLRPLMNRYLANGSRSGDAYLKSNNVIDGVQGLDFDVFDVLDLSATGNHNSQLLTKDGDVRLRVTYRVNYTFGALPLPFAELKITQEVRTKAWLKGSGEGYTG